jgi:alkaline phosphatase D
MSKIVGVVLAAALFVLVAGGAGTAPRPSASNGPTITHGVIVGDVTSSSALLWARADRAAAAHVFLSGGQHGRVHSARALAENDYTVRVPLEGLAPSRTYRYRVWFTAGAEGKSHGRPVAGTFRTAPRDESAASLRLAFGGDVAGQNVCRDATEGFPIMDTVRARHPDVFVGLGDMIYADNPCSDVGLYGNAQVRGDFGPAADLPTFWEHWRYTRAELKLQNLLAGTDYVGVWDDHEVVNDFGPLNDSRSTPPYTPGVHLMPIGRKAFIDYTPVAIAANTPLRLYRSLRWGKNVELFVLDTRQYRDPNFAEDTDARPKTMLGREQLTWLKEELAASDAKWKVIVSSVPMSIPTGFPPTNGRDGWANFDQNTGYERELLDILGFMRRAGIRNTIWITTDVHFAEAFRYTPFTDDPRFSVYEVATGPMNAGIFPTTDFDSTLNPERLAFFAPPSAGAVTSWSQAKHWFNFGELRLTADGSLTVRIVNTAGETEFERTLTPSS